MIMVFLLLRATVLNMLVLQLYSSSVLEVIVVVVVVVVVHSSVVVME